MKRGNVHIKKFTWGKRPSMPKIVGGEGGELSIYQLDWDSIRHVL